MYLVFFLYALLASTFSIGKLLVHLLPPIFLISIRMIIAGTILSTAWYIFDRRVTIKRRDWWLFAIVVLFHILVPFTSEYIALQYISPSSACLMYNLSPFLSAIFSYFIFQETMTMKKWIGFFIGIAGILFYMQSQCCVDLGISWPNLLMLVSVVTSCLGWIFVRILVKNKGYSTLLVNGVSMFIGGWIALPISSYFEGAMTIDVLYIPHIIGLMAAMIFIAAIKGIRVETLTNIYKNPITEYGFLCFLLSTFLSFFLKKTDLTTIKTINNPRTISMILEVKSG